MTIEQIGLNILPSKEEELLLKAAILKGDESINAWNKWKSIVDFDDIDVHSNRLIPLLYSNLSEQGVKGPIVDKYKGLLRKSWYRNNLLLKELNDLLVVFQEAKIDTMLLKGAALINGYYSHVGLRPMGDVDVMVPLDKTLDAINLLEENGLEIVYTQKRKALTRFPIRKFDEVNLTLRGSHGFIDKKHKEFDIHWHLMHHHTNPEDDKVYWDAALPLEIKKNIHTKVLCPTDLLLHIIVHALSKTRNFSIYWVADAMVIIEKSEIDWERLTRLAKEKQVVIYLQLGLAYLAKEFNAPIPEEWMMKIKNLPVSEKEIYYFKSFNNSKLSPLKVQWLKHSQLNEEHSLLKRVVTFPKHLQCFFALENQWQLPFYILKKVI